MKYFLFGFVALGLAACNSTQKPAQVPDYDDTRPGLFSGPTGKFELTKPTIAEDKPEQVPAKKEVATKKDT